MEINEAIQGAIGDRRLFECLQMVELGNQYVLRDDVSCLTWVKSKEIRGAEVQRAAFRRK